MNPPTFCIVIPLYNKAGHIADTINSVLQQSLQDFAIVVVDDGSHDNGPDIVANMTRSDSRITLMTQSNGGVSRARNAGIEYARSHVRSPYLCFLDGDDLWSGGFLAEISQLIEAFPDAGAYTTAYAQRFGDGRDIPVVPAFPANVSGKRHFVFDFFAVASRGELPIMPSSCCIPVEVLNDVGGFPSDEPMGEDQDLWVRIAYRYTMAYSRYTGSFYLQDAENRACVRNVPDRECPFSQRLNNIARNTDDPRRADMIRLTANHILHLAQLNLLAGKRTEASALLRDPRTWMLPKRRLKWELKLLMSRDS